jgi:hypothetical protein
LYDVNGANPNNPLTNQSFSTFVNINDELGNLLYREEHYASTDANGLITVKMGDGLYTAGPITNFNQINWGVGKYYLVVDFDINGTISSTAPEQLVTVPYSFYAGKAGNGMTAVADNGNGTLTFTYANGQTYITPVLSGIQGALGPAGAQGIQGIPGTNGTVGATGQNGLNALIKTTSEAAGANCANGGTMIETGLDANGNGVLDAGEVNVSETQYVCNGVVVSGNQTVSINGVVTNQYVPDYLYNTGNCSNGSLSTTGNYGLTSSFAQYCNLKINSGHIFNLPTNGTPSPTVTILVKDTLFLYGQINGIPTGNHQQTLFNQNTAGGPGGSSSGALTSYTSGVNSLIQWNSYNQSNDITPPSFTTMFTGGSGCASITPPMNITTSALVEATKIRSALYGVDGQRSNPNGYLLTPAVNGGLGGTGLYIICRVLVFNGQINLTGGNGISAYSGWGANVYGGGGGGGSLVISAESIVQNTGTINLNGGTGFPSIATPYCKSSNGGNGAYIIIDR